MDAMHAVLAAAAVVLGVAAAWLGWKLAQASASGAVDRERATRAERDAAAATEGAERLRGELALAVERAAQLDHRVRLLEAELESQAKLHAAELDKAQRIAQTSVEAAETREREFRKEIAERDRQTELRLRDAFRALAGEALKSSNEEFLKLAEQRFAALSLAGSAELEKKREAVDQLLKPIAETLKKTDEKLGSIEHRWTQDRASLGEHLRQIIESGAQLRAETGRLTTALREPNVRGFYGELQLRRVVEVAGMTPYCSFEEQATTVDDAGRMLRPDLIVHLPNGRQVAVDAKANIKPYLEAIAARTPDEAEEHLESFAAGMLEQARRLSSKGYWAQYAGSAEFVVMFVPADVFIDAALKRRPTLLEEAAQHNVVLASPSTLLAVLKAVSKGFQEQKLAEEAVELRKLGSQLHERMGVALDHLARLGKSMRDGVGAYNDFVASYQSRLEPTMRRFQEANAGSQREHPALPAIETPLRQLQGREPG
jgi:DNA recombination protein RmuC